jgi:alpha-D-xyloside xylohydrolase
MKTRLNLLLFAAFLALNACTGVLKQDGNSVTVKVQNPAENGPALVRLEVMGENIIHVSATPEKKFADPQSLIILPVQEQTPFTVAQNGDTVTVAT